MKRKYPRGEIVNPHVFEYVPDPSRAALLQLLDWCSEELKRRNAGDTPSPPQQKDDTSG